MAKLTKKQLKALTKNPMLYELYGKWLRDDSIAKATKSMPECYTGTLTRRRYRAGETIERITGAELDYATCVLISNYLLQKKKAGK